MPSWLIPLRLRLPRVKSLNERDLVALVTYLLARHPDTFPDLLDDALSTISPGGGTGATQSGDH